MPQTQPAVDDYHDALRRTTDRRLHLEPGSPETEATIDRFRAFFADFTPEAVRRNALETYHDHAWFNDTLKTVEGNQAIGAYMAHSAGATVRCEVEIEHAAVADGELYLRWEMRIEFTRFRKGELTRSIGMTHLRAAEDGRIALHQDFWDGANAFFQYVPVLGAGIRWIRGKL